VTYIWYANTLLYYFVSFFGPFYYVAECGKGIHASAHFLYMAYSLINLFFEAWVVYKIQKMLCDLYLLELNRWHFVELLMG
jgi:hypothetical protein